MHPHAWWSVAILVWVGLVSAGGQERAETFDPSKVHQGPTSCNRGDCGDEDAWDGSYDEEDEEEQGQWGGLGRRISKDVRGFLNSLNSFLLEDTTHKGDDVALESMVYFFLRSEGWQRLSSELVRTYQELDPDQKASLARAVLLVVEQETTDVLPLLTEAESLLRDTEVNEVLVDVWKETTAQVKGDSFQGLQQLALPFLRLMSEADVSVKDPEIQRLITEIMSRGQLSPLTLLQVVLEQKSIGPKLTRVINRMMKKIKVDPAIVKEALQHVEMKMDIREKYDTDEKVPASAPPQNKTGGTPPQPSQSSQPHPTPTKAPSADIVSNIVDMASSFLSSEAQSGAIGSLLGSVMGGSSGINPQMILGFLQMMGKPGGGIKLDAFVPVIQMYLDTPGNEGIAYIVNLILGQIPSKSAKEAGKPGSMPNLSEVWATIQEYVAWFLQSEMGQFLVKATPEALKCKKLECFVNVLEKNGNFRVKTVVSRLQKDNLRKQFSEGAAPYLKDFAIPFASKKSREAMIRKATNMANNFFVTQGYKPMEVDKPLEAFSSRVNTYLKERWGVEVQPMRYLFPMAMYYKDIFKTTDGHEIDYDAFSDSEVEAKLAQCFDEEILPPFVHVWKSYQYMLRSPDCSEYVLCSLNHPKFLGNCSGIKRAIIKNSSYLITWHTHAGLPTDGPLDLVHEAIIEGSKGRDCKEMFLPKCVQLKRGQDDLDINFHHDEL